MKLKQKQRILLVFWIGYIMFAAGLFLFAKLEIAEMGLYAFNIGGLHIGKIIICLPLLIGMYRLFKNYESFDARIIVVIGALFVMLPAIQGMKYRFQPIGIKNYLIIIALMFGGVGIIMRAIYMRTKDRHLFEDEEE